tara:strand:- start:484 stop:657 length:174 start_codon:yes stop_codon:yes gene_type:complete
MKSPLKVIEEMVKKYPNDMQLGSKVRWYINWLRDITKKSSPFDELNKQSPPDWEASE